MGEKETEKETEIAKKQTRVGGLRHSSSLREQKESERRGRETRSDERREGERMRRDGKSVTVT